LLRGFFYFTAATKKGSQKIASLYNPILKIKL